MKAARFFWPACCALVLGLPVVLTLAARVPNVNDAEIIESAPAYQAVFVGLGTTSDAGGLVTARKALWRRGSSALLGHQEIHVLLVGYGATLTIEDAGIRVTGTACTYRTNGRAILDNTGLVALVRGDRCDGIGDDRTQLDFEIHFRGGDRVGVATYFVPASENAPAWIALTDPASGSQEPAAMLRGRYADELVGRSYRRVELLAYLWQARTSTIWIAVMVALAAVGCGAALSIGDAGPRAIVRAFAAAGLAALGLGLLYAVLVPPLHAPDEPDHLLDYAQVAREPRLESQLMDLARRGHFQRIHFQPAERFRPVDLGHPFAVPWDDTVFAQPVSGRSVTTWLWWRAVAPALRALDAPAVLMVLRFANAGVFAAGVTAGALLLLMTSGGVSAAPQMAVLALLAVPTLPFFSTHVSEFAMLAPAYVIMAAVTAGLFLGGERVHLLGLPLGVAASLIVAGGRSGLPFVAVVGAALAGRALLGSAATDAVSDVRRPVTFWVGVGLGLALFALLSTPEFQQGLWPGDAGSMPAWFRSGSELFRLHPWYVTAAAPLGLACELAAQAVRRRLRRTDAAIGAAVRTACAIGIVIVLASLATSTFVTFPTLRVIEQSPPASVAAYAGEVITVASTGLRLQNHDWLLSASFWEGFGWLDTIPGEGLVTMLVALTAAAFIALLAAIARTADARRFVGLTVLAGGWAASLVMYAVSSYYLHRNLHGRYVIGLYLSALAIAGCAVAVPRRSNSGHIITRSLSRELVVIAVACAIHAYALAFILGRYF